MVRHAFRTAALVALALAPAACGSSKSAPSAKRTVTVTLGELPSG
jgi:hypothetical protein